MVAAACAVVPGVTGRVFVTFSRAGHRRMEFPVAVHEHHVVHVLASGFLGESTCAAVVLSTADLVAETVVVAVALVGRYDAWPTHDTMGGVVRARVLLILAAYMRAIARLHHAIGTCRQRWALGSVAMRRHDHRTRAVRKAFRASLVTIAPGRPMRNAAIAEQRVARGGDVPGMHAMRALGAVVLAGGWVVLALGTAEAEIFAFEVLEATDRAAVTIVGLRGGSVLTSSAIHTMRVGITQGKLATRADEAYRVASSRVLALRTGKARLRNFGRRIVTFGAICAQGIPSPSTGLVFALEAVHTCASV